MTDKKTIAFECLARNPRKSKLFGDKWTMISIDKVTSITMYHDSQTLRIDHKFFSDTESINMTTYEDSLREKKGYGSIYIEDTWNDRFIGGYTVTNISDNKLIIKTYPSEINRIKESTSVQELIDITTEYETVTCLLQLNQETRKNMILDLEKHVGSDLAEYFSKHPFMSK